MDGNSGEMSLSLREYVCGDITHGAQFELMNYTNIRWRYVDVFYCN
jgi:hypothetical protein